MKTRTTSSKLSVLILAFVALGAMQAQAIIVDWRPVGITFGQTARITAANTGTRALTITGITFLDSAGVVLGRFERQVIEPGKMMSFDLNADAIVREGERIQIRVEVVTPGPNPNEMLRTSLEVFNNDDGRTTVFVIAII